MPTQLFLLEEALRWVALSTGTKYEDLANHMIVIGEVCRVLEQSGRNVGEPYATDYHFATNYHWDDVFELVLAIWGE